MLVADDDDNRVGQHGDHQVLCDVDRTGELGEEVEPEVGQGSDVARHALVDPCERDIVGDPGEKEKAAGDEGAAAVDLDLLGDVIEDRQRCEHAVQQGLFRRHRA